MTTATPTRFFDQYNDSGKLLQLVGKIVGSESLAIGEGWATMAASAWRQICRAWLRFLQHLYLSS
ncbi:MAG: hypothetical protein R3E67_02645 [Pseudomonadales bacterium]